MRRRLLALARVAWMGVAVLISGAALAQDPVNGRALYNTALVVGGLSCGAGSCHGPNPLLNINRISNGDTPGGIGFAISTVRQMSFLRGNVSAAQLTDLAAYIANPAAANGAAVSLSETALNFGSVTLGQKSTRAITITNSGGGPLTVTSVSSNLSDFSVASNTCTQVAPSATCAFSVSFSPALVGTRNASVTIAHNATGGSTAVPLTGIGTQAAQATVALSVASIDFGRAFVGQISSVRRVTLSNTGDVPLAVEGASWPTTHFRASSNSCVAAVVLAPSQSCSVDLFFAPQIATPISADFEITHNGVGSISRVALSGVGVVLPAGTKLMVEYVIPSLNYFFMTSRADEQALLDGVATFSRTGAAFPVYSGADAGRASMTRYFFPEAAKSASRGTHFYTLLDAEKSLLANVNPTNTYAAAKPFNEGLDSYALLPLVEGKGGSCAQGLAPVYRVFRGAQRFPDDANHRFTIDRAVYEAFVAAGWDDEGVRFCVPAP